jgi:hypothetical protein
MDILMLAVSYVGVLAIGALIGYKINDWLMRSTFDVMLEEAGITDAQLAKFARYWGPKLGDEIEITDPKPQVQIRIELVNDDLFCYEKATDRFLGQAKTREELIDVLTERLGPVSLFIQPEDGADYIKEKA